MERIVIDITSDPSKLQATIDQLNKMGAVDAKNAQQFKKNNQDFNNGLNNTSKIASVVNDKITSIGKTIVAAFAVERVFSFTKEIINVRAEFQKFEAQLITALGNKSAAQAALNRITQLAKETPFSVKELTESFVRLANRGINASNQQLKKLGDVAAALGKPMEQVIEAILDINNTERWNELGVKVKTNGDKITGTFKGMTVEMEKTEEGAMKMIEKFGELDTVTGGMERQMETLGGVMSNLGDNWDKLLNALGEQTQGVLYDTINALSQGIDWWGRYYHAASNIEKIGVELPGAFRQWMERRLGIGNASTEAQTLVQINEQLEASYGAYTETVMKNAQELQKQYSERAKLAKSEEERANLQVELSKKIDQANNKEQLSYVKKLKDMIEYDNMYADDPNWSDLIYKKEKVVKDYMEKIAKNNDYQKDLNKSLDKYKDLLAGSKNNLKPLHKSTESFTEILPPLIKKLEELKFAYRELDVSRLKDYDKLNAQRKLDEEKAQKEYDDELVRITDLNNKKKLKKGDYDKAVIYLESILNQQLLNIKKKYGFNIEDLDREIALRHAEHLKKMNDMEISMMEMGRDNEEEIYQLRLKTAEDYYNKLIELEKDQEKREELIQQKKLELAKIDDAEKKRKLKAIEDERNEARRHEIAMMEITEQGEKEILKKKMEYSAEDLDRMREDFGEGSDEYQKELNHYLELEAEFNKKSKDGKKEWVKDWVTGINEVLQAMLEAMNNMVQAEIDANNIRMDNQREILETQRTLAAKGLENTLAFEQKRNDEMAKQQIDLQRKQQRIKELQIFLNAMAKFAEEDPKSALTKALSLIAATKVAETIFAEEGAIVGTHETKFRGQRHRSGRDRIAIVEDGEVILPKAKAIEMGLNSKSKFSQFLKTPFSEKIMPVAVAQVDNYDKLARELKELKEIVKNKQEVTINWDNFDTRIETRIKGSLKEVTKVKKSRI
jgi:hypothetical protein